MFKKNMFAVSWWSEIDIMPSEVATYIFQHYLLWDKHKCKLSVSLSKSVQTHLFQFKNRFRQH